MGGLVRVVRNVCNQICADIDFANISFPLDIDFITCCYTTNFFLLQNSGSGLANL